MPDIIDYTIHNNIALITLNQPPVNSLGHALRCALHDSVNQAFQDDSVKAIVLASHQKVFCGGADITEFGTDKAFAEPGLPQLCNDIDDGPKLVIAAIDGAALGGGCELTLACDYRFASAGSKLGLPEVHLGILPGAGGTQRLPRLVGVDRALDMIVSGKPVPAASLQDSGLIDALASDNAGSFIEQALAFTETLIVSNASKRPTRDIPVPKVSEDLFSDFRQTIARKSRGFIAPEQCIQAVEAACQLTLDEGLKREAELFSLCMESPQARAQQHLFFAERQATKIPGIVPETPSRKINKVAIIGSGTMGGGIAMNFMNAGIATVILDLNEDALKRGTETIHRNYMISARKGRLSEDDVQTRMSRLSTTTEYSELSDADLIIEAVFENLDIKKKVFAELDKVCQPGAILATNTSTLDINRIADSISRPEDVVGLHFFSPANVMRLLEIVRAEKTADDVIVTALKTAKRIGKVPAVVGVCFGFVGNRMLEPYGREASRLILEGASPAQIDQALTGFGMAMGPLSMSDLAGIDVGFLVRESRRDELSHDSGYQKIQDELYHLGRYGQKTGRGHYLYKGRTQQEDPEVITMASALAKELGIHQREISQQEIIERTIYMLINEGAQILDEGIAYRASDCDLIWTNGYGFPVWRGGPMHYANEIGLQTVVDAIEKYRLELGEYGEKWFTPAPLLKKLAAEGKDFSSYVNPRYA